MKHFLLLPLIFAATVAAFSQPTLIGARPVPGGGVEIVRWQAMDSASLESFPTSLQGYMLSSSVFDAYNGNYYLNGVTGSGNCLFAFNSPTNATSAIPFANGSNITEIDMSNGSIYTITMDTSGAFNVNQLNLATGNSSLLGMIGDPAIMGMVVDATAFDSEHGILFTEVVNNAGAMLLCRIFVRNEVFQYDFVPIQLQNPLCNYTCFHYDNLNNRLFALKMDNSGGGGTAGVVEINDSTGAVTDIGSLPPVTGIVAGSSCFDQQTGTYLIVAVGTSQQTLQIAFSTVTAASASGYIPDRVSEIVCDNYSWAQAHYGLNGTGDGSARSILRLYPNPCDTRFTVDVKSSDPHFTVSLYDSQGRKCLSQASAHSTATLSTGSLPAGIYLVTIDSGTDHLSRKLEIMSAH